MMYRIVLNGVALATSDRQLISVDHIGLWVIVWHPILWPDGFWPEYAIILRTIWGVISVYDYGSQTAINLFVIPVFLKL